ncbi:MAG: hypothetical protein C0613_03450 [Desulfobulbaceae bacterium]|nr:MAG: hypothetical protein C0613_03450 [Desulfobulbaceae bacterium]
MPGLARNSSTIFASAALFCLWGLSRPAAAWAVQSHGGAEGLVAHQLGHILFFIGMIGLLVNQHYRQLRGPGWRHFKLFLRLILLWNIQAFSGHWMHESVAADKFITINGRTVAFQITSLFDLLFYITRLDHLVLVPAFIFLFMAIKRWQETP